MNNMVLPSGAGAGARVPIVKVVVEGRENLNGERERAGVGLIGHLFGLRNLWTHR